MLRAGDSLHNTPFAFSKPIVAFICIAIIANSLLAQVNKNISQHQYDWPSRSLLTDDWQRQHPVESGWRLTSVSMVDTMHAWASGWHDSAAGLVVRTTDGGESWSEVTRTFPLNVNDVHFATSALGWVVGGSSSLGQPGYVRRTTDSGQSWTTQITAPNVVFRSVFFLDTARGWVGGDSGKILATTNGGLDWQAQAIGRRTSYQDILLLPSGTGWCGGIGAVKAVLKTTNFGLQWDSVANFDLNALSFLNDSLGWAVTTGGAVSGFRRKTTDGGRTWTVIQLGYIFPTDVVMLSDSGVFTTIWDGRFDPPPAHPLTLLGPNGGIETRATILDGIAFSPQGHGIAVGLAHIVSSTDSGRTWRNQAGPLRDHLNSIDMVDSSVGWAVGDLELILRTTNGGSLWIPQTPAATGVLFAVSAVDRLHGFAGGTVFMSTIDGGETWSKSPTPENFTISGLSFLDTLRGWVVTLENRVFRTIDGGESWTQQQTLPAFELDDVDFVDSSYGWCVGNSVDDPERIFATTNGGMTWIGIPTGATQPQEFWSVDFVDRSYGWAVGLRLVVKTTDGGNTWDTSYVSPDARLFGVRFTNCDTGWVVGERGRILGTTDGGTTWLVLREAGGINDQPLYSVDAVSSRLAWTSGAYGEIFHTTNGGGITSVRNVAAEIPARFELGQNYPNPFNATTRIRFGITTSGHVSLRIYDILGREVVTLVDEHLQPGYFDSPFAATQLVSGVYFYRLTAGSYTDTRKLVVLK